MIKDDLLEKIRGRTAVLGVVGLGYVGLPLAVEFARAGFDVTGFDVDESKVAEINAGERPLGLYVFGDDQTLNHDLLERTHSGGACVNTCAVQGALPSLGFGGSGMSGMGRHHGIEGFREFSNQRGVVIRGEGDLISAFYSPYEKAAGLVQAVLSSS